MPHLAVAGSTPFPFPNTAGLTLPSQRTAVVVHTAVPPVTDDLVSVAPAQPVSTASPALSADASEHFRRGVVECKSVQVERFIRNALLDLLAPRDGCPSQCFSSHAKLRDALAEILTFHPQGNETSVAQVIGQLGLPSLLRDDPAYAPGTLSALRYDVGMHAVASGIYSVSGGEPTEDEYLYFGDSELMFLDHGNAYRRDVASAHASIIDFHYAVAGLAGQGARAGDTRKITPAMMHLADFTDHLARCQQRREVEPLPVAEARTAPRAGIRCAIV